MSLFFKPLTISNWLDVEQLFGEKGACGGCWCMWWRLRNKDYENSKGAKNKELFQGLVKDHHPLGIVAYKNKKPIAWCSISPRKSLKRLETSRLFKPVDKIPVWSITCIFVDKYYRKKGLSVHLIEEATKFAFENGGTVVEAYPIAPKKGKTPDVFAYVGIKSAYLKAGFKSIKQCSETRLIMRKEK